MAKDSVIGPDTISNAIKWLWAKCKATFLPNDRFREAYLGWGGRDINSDLSPIDAAMSSLHNTNLSELCDPDGITIEYTRDKGATWIDYGASDENKVKLLSAIGWSVVLGKTGPGDEKNTDIGLRITLNGDGMGIYAEIKKLLINFNTIGATGCTVTFEFSQNDSNGKPTENWKLLKTSPINGWSGWNSYYLNQRIGSSSYAGRLRMTFYISGVSQNGYSSSATIYNIILLGPNRWTTPSTIARTGHLYSYDWRGNADFPGNVQAKTLNGHTLQTDVPAGAKFTDTTYGVATQSANGLLSAGDKQKLDGLANRKVFGPFTVGTSAWAADGGRVKANIAVSGITANDIAQVIFNPSSIDSYELKPYCSTANGTVTIYAGGTPGGNVTVEKIVV